MAQGKNFGQAKLPVAQLTILGKSPSHPVKFTVVQQIFRIVESIFVISRQVAMYKGLLREASHLMHSANLPCSLGTMQQLYAKVSCHYEDHANHLVISNLRRINQISFSSTISSRCECDGIKIGIGDLKIWWRIVIQL